MACKGERPFDAEDAEQLAAQVDSGKATNGKSFGKEVNDLIAKMLNPVAEERATLFEVSEALRPYIISYVTSDSFIDEWMLGRKAAVLLHPNESLVKPQISDYLSWIEFEEYVENVSSLKIKDVLFMVRASFRTYMKVLIFSRFNENKTLAPLQEDY